MLLLCSVFSRLCAEVFLILIIHLDLRKLNGWVNLLGYAFFNILGIMLLLLFINSNFHTYIQFKSGLNFPITYIIYLLVTSFKSDFRIAILLQFLKGRKGGVTMIKSPQCHLLRKFKKGNIFNTESCKPG